MSRKPLLWLLLTLVAILLITAVAPPERSLGTNVRIVYLHGAWVWAALLAIIAAAFCGLVGLVTGRLSWQRWSVALGRTGLVFWITYLPLSMWASQANWNGLFLAEPRWRLAFIFALGGLALQTGLAIIDDLALASGLNIFYALALFWALRTVDNVMHPDSPIFSSDVTQIQVFFLALVGLTLFAALQVARWWKSVSA